MLDANRERPHRLHRRNKPVPHGMTPQNGAQRHPLEAGEFDIVAREHVNHRRAHQPVETGNLQQHKRHHRQDDLRQLQEGRLPRAQQRDRGQQVEDLRAEQQDQQHPEHEFRHGVDRDAEEHDDTVRQPVAAADPASAGCWTRSRTDCCGVLKRRRGRCGSTASPCRSRLLSGIRRPAHGTRSGRAATWCRRPPRMPRDHLRTSCPDPVFPSGSCRRGPSASLSTSRSRPCPGGSEARPAQRPTGNARRRARD
ncbi:hypothetical protein LX76_01414 [Cereibacter changlensis]|uniref:Uncharacterized protein n=1 Tax=Cereibacter changlensis TaxID=402884 RepID=A0A2W7RZR1_9RHOB|nr:hypothetical protein LX76_01414 [Cereibacter changlensis]